ncbi:hypothetical protein K6U06_00010 [Acidiferrimicrobium sp. IK]|uniref:hypothetical protein n=1 Tax=Acidiferrimicrobium sp. IK TaxID=2871700 RepID=UPI0021CB59C9|nr:hypothetical protein [Acidiferrimicrobium sp. IK]MCU4182729.1 hypothetical protein [Acidiferrimicrobium sp. IK]
MAIAPRAHLLRRAGTAPSGPEDTVGVAVWIHRAEQLTDLQEQYRRAVGVHTRSIANQLVGLAFAQPILTARVVESRLRVTRPAALSALRQLEQLGILREAPGGVR